MQTGNLPHDLSCGGRISGIPKIREVTVKTDAWVFPREATFFARDSNRLHS